MGLTHSLLTFVALAISVFAQQDFPLMTTTDTNYDVLQFVNQLIGSNNGGL